MNNDVKVSEKVSVQIKGIREGILVKLGQSEWPIMQEALLEHIAENGAFFQGAKIALDVGSQVLHVTEISSLRDKLSDSGVSLWAILSESNLTQNTARNFGFKTEILSLNQEKQVKPINTVLGGEEAVFVQKTLRSGFKVAYQGHVVVMGDVNPGAEIIATGSVIVWGRLRGVVHAGAEGNDNAVVCALDMAPTQLRIASLVAIMPNKKGKPKPEMASVKNGQVIAEPWVKS